MASIYGGIEDPFHHLEVQEQKPQSILDRYDEIDRTV